MDSDSSSTFAGLMAGGFLLTILIFGLVVTALFVWLFWRVFEKAGYSGATGLLCLIPSVGPIVCMIILAFGTWPNERTAWGPPPTMPTPV